jgi:hypothetical protein
MSDELAGFGSKVFTAMQGQIYALPRAIDRGEWSEL